MGILCSVAEAALMVMLLIWRFRPGLLSHAQYTLKRRSYCSTTFSQHSMYIRKAEIVYDTAKHLTCAGRAVWIVNKCLRGELVQNRTVLLVV